jgi:hypothetical protein
MTGPLAFLLCCCVFLLLVSRRFLLAHNTHTHTPLVGGPHSQQGVAAFFDQLRD